MAKHKKTVDCGMCNGSGTISTTDDGKSREITCVGCNGSGKQ
jgi:DnaJ-class molecular chaperone